MLIKAPLLVKHAKVLASKSFPSFSVMKRSFLTISDTEEEVPSPLLDLKEMAMKFNYCDENGFRKPDQHWSFVVSACESYDAAPSTRTINFQRISQHGIDFVSKKKAESIYDFERPVSFLYTEGKYKPGHKVTQWRGEGVCAKIELEELLAYVPEYTLTEIVASCRARKEMDNMSERQSITGVKSRFIEIVQETRQELANSQITMEELNSCIEAWRFLPSEMEKMVGGTDEIMWDRWEFRKEEGSEVWKDARQLMPY